MNDRQQRALEDEATSDLVQELADAQMSYGGRGERGPEGPRGPAPEVWKEIAIALAAVLFAVAGSWFAFGRDAVSQAEVKNLIVSASPYALDKGQIAADLRAQDRAISTLTDEHRTLDDEIRSLLAQVARLEGQIASLQKKAG